MIGRDVQDEIPDRPTDPPVDPASDAGESDAFANALAHAFGPSSRAAATPPASGERIGHYEILEEIGRGGQGIVYRALDTKHGRVVAIKVLPPSAQPSAAALARFQREAQVASRISQAGICAIYDSGFFGGGAWIAMQLVDGRSLADLIRDAKSERERGRSAFDAVAIAEKAARAVHAAHEAGIVHRDLKPANIVVDGNSQPFILDFGLARDLDEEGPSLTLTGEVFGTLAYMSPEQLSEKRVRIDRRTDVFSLGVVLYECLTHERPFQGLTRESQLRAILSQDPPDPRSIDPGIPKDVAAILECALEKDRDRRYQTALDFAEELRRIRQHEPVLARRAGPFLRLRRWAGRNPAVASLCAAVLVVLVAGLAVSLHFMHAARSTLSEFERLADARRLESLVEEAREELWPAVPEKAPAMAAWVRRARDLSDRLPEHQSILDALRSRALPYSPESARRDEASHEPVRLKAKLLTEQRQALARIIESNGAPGAAWHEDARLRVADYDREIARFESTAARRLTWQLTDERDQWRHDQEMRFVEALTSLLGDDRFGETIAGVEARLRQASTLRHDTIDAHQQAWEEAAARIASSSRYRELRLKPQLGIVPLGPDRASGLEEFAHIGSGLAPERDPATGNLRIASDSGIVLVLLPGGTFLMGSQAEDEDGPNFDPSTDRREGPVHEVEIAPFFMSKFEMTQGQWLRATGSYPARYLPGTFLGDSPPTSLMNPVEQVSWDDCARVVSRLALTLPTEAQWEYACRAGTRTPWWTGRDLRSLTGAANLADLAAQRAQNSTPKNADWPDLDDGHAVHAPIGTFRPNGFGLHEVHGNVSEWCRDNLAGYEIAPRPGDGLRIPRMSERTRICRGGGHLERARYARSAFRFFILPGQAHLALGVRPARSIDP